MNFSDAQPIATNYYEKFSAPNSCFTNIYQIVKAHGGSAVFGWLAGDLLLPENPLVRVWVHHCVWANYCGDLIDITPQIISEKGKLTAAALRHASLFLRDDSATLLDVGNGLVQTRSCHYEALADSYSVTEAIAFFNRSDAAITTDELDKADYWARRAFKTLFGSVPPLLRSTGCLPFKLDEPTPKDYEIVSTHWSRNA